MITIETTAAAQAPKGAPFIIDRCPFTPGEQLDIAMLDLDDDKILNWPMVYILANNDEAYIGQTTSVATRMSQHGANPEKSAFTQANIIFNEEFNTSVITDYEHRLIGLMHADGRYQLTNKNDGMTDTNYFSKDAYSHMFNDLWEELQRLELADHTIAELEESEVFKYSPYKGLTTDQKVALGKILAAIDNGLENAKPIVVEGMPGTGKTILAIYLLKTLKDNPKYKDMNIRIVEPVTSLRNTLRQSLKNVSGLSPNDVIAPTDIAKPDMGYSPDDGKSFDIVLVDEAHKLKRRVNLGTQYGNFDRVSARLGLPKETSQMDWIISQTKLPIFFYDPLQSIGPSCLGMEVMESSLGSALHHPIQLDTQMRVKGGKAYLDRIKGFLADENPSDSSFDNYEFVIHDDFSEFVESFERCYAKHNLSRMVAGYAWKWESNPSKCKDPSVKDIVIDGIGLKWNCTYDNWVVKGTTDPEIAHEVGCIHSIQGYDLSYAYVIIGDDLTVDQKTGKLVANKNSYYDRNGYATATQEQLDQYIKNIYYVLLTRGIYGTHVYAANPKMREHLKRFLK
ncbi:MAG: DUF2075 domain-containing protein [Coriobacteriia bacterium]|nr:DUF2075 domain-containing protein [Coriobacteriia bacterium]